MNNPFNGPMATLIVSESSVIPLLIWDLCFDFHDIVHGDARTSEVQVQAVVWRWNLAVAIVE